MFLINKIQEYPHSIINFLIKIQPQKYTYYIYKNICYTLYVCTLKFSRL